MNHELRKEDNQPQGHFGYLVPKDKQWYSTKEAAAIVGRSDQYIRDCFDSQKIMGHLLNGRAGKGNEKRQTYQVHRDCLILYLLETANYDPGDYLERVCEIILRLHPSQIEEIKNSINLQ